jgi:hypothetical protein
MKVRTGSAELVLYRFLCIHEERIRCQRRLSSVEFGITAMCNALPSVTSIKGAGRSRFRLHNTAGMNVERKTVSSLCEVVHTLRSLSVPGVGRLVRLSSLAPLPVMSCVFTVLCRRGNKQGQETGNRLYSYFRHVADWIRMSYEDHLLSEQENRVLLTHGVDPLLELVWETAQQARGEHRKVLDYLHQSLGREAL